MSKEIRIGVFGMSRGASYYEMFKKEDAFEIVAVCERRAGCVKDIIEKNEVPVFADFDEFLAYGKEHGMNAVFLANFFNEHAPYAIKVMEAGMAAISETLPASTLKEAVELVRCYERTGSKYMFAENYPFMPGNLELKRLVDSGTLGSAMYFEGEYNHHDRGFELKERTRGKYHWRNWEPRAYYITHSLGPIMYMTNSSPRYVSGHAAYSMIQAQDNKFRPINDGMAMMLCEFDNGTIGRFSGCNGVMYNKLYRVLGDKGSAEYGLGHGDSVRLSYYSTWKPELEPSESIYTPVPAKLDPQMAKAVGAGHGGSDYIVVQKMIEYLRDGKEPFFDVYRAAEMSAAAVLGWRSCLNHGENFRIPDFRKEEERKTVEDDDLTPFKKADGTGNTVPVALNIAEDWEDYWGPDEPGIVTD